MTTTGSRIMLAQTEGDAEELVPSEPPTKATGSFEGPAYTPARALLAHFGRWVGDDLEELLKEVYETRSKVSW